MRFIKRLILIIIILALLTAIGIASFFIYNGHKMYEDYIGESPLEKKVASIRDNKDFTGINDVPKYFTDAIIAVEDHRYKEHGAIDLIAIFRALVSNAKAKELNEGGSTLTQQVAKNLYFMSEKNYRYRKIAEAFVAFDLENKYSKDEILELYINTIYYGQGYYGIKQAANGYYNKEPKDLTLDEATVLAGVPNAPSVYNPVSNPNLAKNRQQKVISDMVEYGYLTKEEAEKIK